MSFDIDVCVVGGAGRVGLPLAITLADRGYSVAIYDTSKPALDRIARGEMPFLERGAEPVLARVVNQQLRIAPEKQIIRRAKYVIVVIGTPVDEHLNPRMHDIIELFESIASELVPGQCVVLRSTVFPGTTAKVHQLLARLDTGVHVAFCPERVAEGRAMEELVSLPQIVSGCDPEAIRLATELFKPIAPSIIELSPVEAELTKIFANAWRYIQFATANQFFMIATNYDVDFHTIHDALTRDYPRMTGLPSSGFAAGPCLFKDTMQLAAADNHNFFLGHAAMLVNEGLPNFLVRHAKRRWDLSTMTVGILGMAFKANSDDARESLSYKLRKALLLEAREVLCTDVYIRDSSFVSVEELLSRSDLIVVGTPHRAYKDLQIPEDKPLIDIWNAYGRGVGLS